MLPEQHGGLAVQASLKHRISRHTQNLSKQDAQLLVILDEKDCPGERFRDCLRRKHVVKSIQGNSATSNLSRVGETADSVPMNAERWIVFTKTSTCKERSLDKNEQILAHAAAIWFCFVFLSSVTRGRSDDGLMIILAGRSRDSGPAILLTHPWRSHCQDISR